MHMTPLDTSESPHAKLLTLPLVSTVLEGGFWFEKSSINRNVTLKHGYKEMAIAGNFNNLQLVFGQGSGQFRGLLFADSDLYKWLEAVSYELTNCYDLELNEMADTLIDLIEKAQGNDGYINSYWEVVEPGKRWTDLAHGHELYCAGHLIQAGIAHHRSTKDTRLLNIALRFADYINSEFNHSGLAASPGHPEIELALIELYRHTGKQKYLNLCRYFLDQRGTNSHHSDQFMPIYYQDHIPVRNARTMAGHAVRQLYLTSGMADLYLETGEKTLLDALERQWNDMATHHLFITGGVGSQHEGESFGTSYDLPNEKCYCETCAQIANIMWNWRMLLITGESKYADLIELIMFNGFISGVSVKGDKFFYENPLQNRKTSEGSERRSGERHHWYRCACCPPNIMRTISSINQYFATMTERGIQIHQFGEYSIKHSFETLGQVILKSQTEYPWNGTVLINVLETPAEEWALSFRNPGWCVKLSITINGQRLNGFTERDGYIHIDRYIKCKYSTTITGFIIRGIYSITISSSLSSSFPSSSSISRSSKVTINSSI